MNRSATDTQPSCLTRKATRRATAAPRGAARGGANISGGNVTAEDNAPAGAGAAGATATAEDLRQRYRRAGELIRDVFRLPPDAAPDLVTRDAYLIVVSRIIRAITEPHDGSKNDDGKEELSTADLVALSKALAEHRRLNTAELEIERRFPEKTRAGDTLSEDAPKPLPPSFRRVVEQLYGTNMDGPRDKQGASGGKEQTSR